MTVAPDALVNQAVFAWLRINGYVVPGTIAESAQAVAAPPQVIAPMPVPEVPAPEPSPPSLRVAQEGVVQRIAEIEASAAKVIKPQSAWARPPVEPPVPDEEDPVVTGESTIPSMKATGEPEADPEGSERTVFLKASPLALWLEREGHDPIRINQERFVIGRGPQCDLVIDSARVSREHVALSRKGVTFLLEDLGSSNGTWFNDERISVRELESGDVIVLGNEAMTFMVRSE